MMITITGTPGVGKSSAAGYLEKHLDNSLGISINSLLENYDLGLGIDKTRGYEIVDTQKMIPVVDKLKDENPDKIIIFEGHLAQDYPSSDIVVVLRCNPVILRSRLEKRGWSERKVHENVSAEILGICTQESYDTYGDMIQEIDTTGMTVRQVACSIADVIYKKKTFSYGRIDYLDEFFTYL